MHKESELHEYQKRVADAIVAWGKIACWLDCGLGKTIIAMTAVRRLLDEGRIHSVLVIAPKSVCENVWAQEAVSWEHTKNLRVSIIAGNASERLKAADVSADIYVVSRDNFAWLSETNTMAITDTDMLILDESTSFKHRNKGGRHSVSVVNANGHCFINFVISFSYQEVRQVNHTRDCLRRCSSSTEASGWVRVSHDSVKRTWNVD